MICYTQLVLVFALYYGLRTNFVDSITYTHARTLALVTRTHAQTHMNMCIQQRHTRALLHWHTRTVRCTHMHTCTRIHSNTRACVCTHTLTHTYSNTHVSRFLPGKQDNSWFPLKYISTSHATHTNTHRTKTDKHTHTYTHTHTSADFNHGKAISE